MKRPRRLNRKKSRRNFKRSAGTHKANRPRRNARGGIRF